MSGRHHKHFSCTLFSEMNTKIIAYFICIETNSKDAKEIEDSNWAKNNFQVLNQIGKQLAITTKSHLSRKVELLIFE